MKTQSAYSWELSPSSCGGLPSVRVSMTGAVTPQPAAVVIEYQDWVDLRVLQALLKNQRLLGNVYPRSGSPLRYHVRPMAGVPKATEANDYCFLNAQVATVIQVPSIHQ